MRLGSIILILLVLATLSPMAQDFHTGIAPTQSPTPSIATGFSSPQRFTSSSNTNFSPSLIQAPNGTIWTFYSVTPMGPNGQPSNPQIHYRTSNILSAAYNSSLWSAEQTLVSTPTFSQNVSPSASFLSNGTIFLAFSSNRTGPYNIYLKKLLPSQGWQPETQVTWLTSNDKEPSVVAAKDGSVWVFWYRVISGTQYNLYYKVSRNGVWSADTALTTDASAQNTDPSAYQMRDGNIWLAWSHFDSSIGQVLFYKIYNTSTGIWSSQIQLTSTSNPDMHPALTEDENNTIWLAWSRELSCGGTCFQWDTFYKYTINSGTSWTADTNLSNDALCTSNCPDDIMSSDAQLKDGRIYVFWASTRDPQQYWNLYYSATSPQPFHYTAVTDMAEAPLKLRDYNSVTINVTVADLGTFPESFWLFIKATNTTHTTIAAQFLSLAPGQSMNLQILWNTNGMQPAKYLMTATIAVSQTETEIVTGDNVRAGGIVWLVPPGDVNMDGCANILDLGIVALAYHSVPGSPNWNPAADLNNDASVAVDDLSIVAFWYHVCT